MRKRNSKWTLSGSLSCTCHLIGTIRATEKMRKITSIDSTSIIYTPNPMFDHLLESSRLEYSQNRSNVGFGEEIDIIEIQIRTLSGDQDPVAYTVVKDNYLCY